MIIRAKGCACVQAVDDMMLSFRRFQRHAARHQVSQRQKMARMGRGDGHRKRRCHDGHREPSACEISQHMAARRSAHYGRFRDGLPFLARPSPLYFVASRFHFDRRFSALDIADIEKTRATPLIFTRNMLFLRLPRRRRHFPEHAS